MSKKSRRELIEKIKKELEQEPNRENILDPVKLVREDRER